MLELKHIVQNDLIELELQSEELKEYSLLENMLKRIPETIYLNDSKIILYILNEDKNKT